MEDRYRDRARAEFFAEVADAASPRVTRPLPELGGRSLASAWAAGDREAVARWLDEQYAVTEAIVEAHRADPEYMARIRALQSDRRPRHARSA
ncbi:MAG: hypothetical protein ACRDZR_06985 [Acidimicrobiales bacterium]